MTLKPDGSPRTVVVWADLDEDDHILLSAAKDGRWLEDLRRDARAAVTVVNSDDTYEYVTIDGTAVAISTEDAGDVIDRLAMKYTGAPYRYPGTSRVTVRIAPLRSRYRAPGY